MTSPNSPESRSSNDSVAIGSEAKVGVPTIKITTHLWIQWSWVAVENCNTAGKSREQNWHSSRPNSDLLLKESCSSMVAICASVFAVEAFVASAARLVMDAETIAKWEGIRGRPPKSASRIRETLSQAIPRPLADPITDRWLDPIHWRNASVHFLEESGVPVPHPIGTNTSPEDARYCFENSYSATSLLLETLAAVRDNAKPSIGPLIAGGFPTLVQALQSELSHPPVQPDAS